MSDITIADDDHVPEYRHPYDTESVNPYQRDALGNFAPSDINAPYDRGPPRVTDTASYDAVAPGQSYIDPEGITRSKPIRNAADYEQIAEGAEYLDPDGTKRRKPKFEGVGFRAQTLHDMAVTPAERKKALEYMYPGKVREEGGALVVDDEGVQRKPGATRGAGEFAGAVSAAAAPTVASVLGAIGAGALTAPTGIGAIAGAGVGGMGGGFLGQTFNDAVLGLTGVYDRTPVEQAAATGMSGMMGAAGTGVGRGLATVVPSLRAGVSAATAAAPGAARYILGASEENLRMAKALREQDVLVPPSSVFKDSPYLQTVVETFDPTFHTEKPLQQSAAKHFSKQSEEIQRGLGIENPVPVIDATEAVSSKELGERLTNRALADAEAVDVKLAQAMEKRRGELEAGLPEQAKARDEIIRLKEQEREAAQRLVNDGYADIDRAVNEAYRTAQSGGNSGDLWNRVGARFQELRRGIGERANRMYDDADRLAGGDLPDTAALAPTAQRMLDELPEAFQANNPVLVRRLAQVAGTEENPAAPLTFGELHKLRSMFRGAADWHTLSGDFKNGSYKFFSRQIDNILHDANASPNLRAASAALREADRFWAENIPIFESRQIKAVMKGLESGEPADPTELYRIIAKEGHTDMVNRIRDMVGPNLWAGVRAADMQDMLNSARTLIPGQLDGGVFVREVLDRERAGLLGAIHGREQAARLLQQARDVAALEGKLPINATTRDSISDIVARARTAATELDALAKQDPTALLNREVRKAQGEMKAQAAIARKNDPLGFLANPSLGAIKAADKVLANEDLILQVATRFGQNSDEMNMLRQVYAQRLLQSTMQPSEKLAKISPEVQAVLFPGVTMAQMEKLAKEMDFLLNTKSSQDSGRSIAAQSRVLHPIGGKAGVLSGAAKIVPGSAAAARAGLAAYYAMVRNAVNHPVLFNFLLKGLDGTAEQREVSRRAIQQILQRGSAVGAGAAQGAYQSYGDAQ